MSNTADATLSSTPYSLVNDQNLMLVVAPATRATVTAKRLSVVGWCHCSSAVVGRCQPGAKKIVVVVVVVVVVEVVPCTIQLLLQPIFLKANQLKK